MIQNYVKAFMLGIAAVAGFNLLKSYGTEILDKLITDKLNSKLPDIERKILKDLQSMGIVY